MQIKLALMLWVYILDTSSKQTDKQKANNMQDYLLIAVLGVLVGLLITMIQLTTIGGV